MKMAITLPAVIILTEEQYLQLLEEPIPTPTCGVTPPLNNRPMLLGWHSTLTPSPLPMQTSARQPALLLSI